MKDEGYPYARSNCLVLGKVPLKCKKVSAEKFRDFCREVEKVLQRSEESSAEK